jgi:glucokinase
MADDRRALGIDVGGTKVALAVIDRDGAVLGERRVRDRDHADATALLEAVGVEARALAGEAPVDGVGVGMCELVDPSGEVVSATTIPWKRADLERVLAAIAPLTVDADVRAAARAEARFGAGRPFGSFGYVTVGTGISSAFVRDGDPWSGAHGAAQLLGSARIGFPCPSCGRVVDVCLEDVASGAGIARRYAARSHADAGAADDVVAAADRGDHDAADVLTEAAIALGSFLALFVNLFDPEAMVIGGGLAAGGSTMLGRALETARARIWAPHVRSIPLLPGELGPSAGAIGAAWTVWAAPA